MNVLFIMAGSDRSGVKDNNYPLSLVEVNGVPLIEKQIEKAKKVAKNLIFAIKTEDSKKYRLDSIISLISPEARIINVESETQGAACTALLAVGSINNDDSLLILSVDDFLKIDLERIINHFISKNYDGGTVVFNSVHPRYSFVKLNANEEIIEAAEKNPISRFATTGLFYFKKGKYFVEAAQSMIRKDASVNGKFFISPVFNEMILSQLKLGVFKIDNSLYLPIKSEVQLNHFINSMEKDFTNEN